MKKLFCIAMCVCALSIGSAQNFEWATAFGSTGEDVVKDMTVDSSGNIYVTGYFTDAVTISTLAGTSQLNSNGSYDIFIAKLDSNGNFLWALGMGGSSDDYGTSIATDLHGHVYITGVYNESFDANPGLGTALLTSAGGLDIFVLELDSDGNFIDANTIGGTGYEESTSIGVDASDNIYVSGYFYSTTEFNPGGTSVELSSMGLADGFIAKYASNGTFEWAKQYGGDDFDLPMAMKVMANGDLYFTGEFRETADFDPDPVGVYNVSTPANYKGAFLLHTDSNGDLVEAIKVGQSSQTGIIGMDLDIDTAGVVYVTGYFRGLLTMNTGTGASISLNSGSTNNGYVAQVDMSNGVVWANQLVNTNGNTAYGMALSSDGILYVSGFYEGSLTMGTLSLTSAATINAFENFLVKLDTSGNFLDAYRYAGASFVDGHYLEVDGNDNVIISGAFEDTVDLDPSVSGTLTQASTGFRDSYVIKMSAGTLGVYTPQAYKLTVYPNPASGIIHLRSPEQLIGKHYRIFDISGKVITQGEVGAGQQISLDLLSGGVYILSIENLENLRVIKL